ncbi:hypothetical protein HYPSUDRAFT_208538 [Hypholoma sublateritium FD-334 SS-4]|uniref:Fungal-type protein kinase domain-containing protein n=1 Tax=Hypholoma sublateritium (strain FD-334 SS-4) TaxID=945553 RepID=A0A0D2KJ49_HYPSF|nr:hypothetical protein HYPSUDRAFT_208538 [Hypholoma sublateritium FD-334 SS-4]
MGWDPAIRVNPSTAEVMSIDVTGFLEDTGVVVTLWIVRDEQGRFFVLKDSWTLANRSVSEVDFIQHITRAIQDDPDGYLFKYICPRYHIGQEKVWSTETIRGQLDKGPVRIQRRIVTGPIGDPITSFRSKREFVSVLLDIVNGLEFLNNKVGVIHGDISMNNIMINRVWGHGPDDSPSQLRAIACAAAGNIANANNQNNSMSQSTVQALATSTAVSQASTSTTDITASAAQVPTTLPSLTQAPAAFVIAPVPAVPAIAQAPAAPAVAQAPAAPVVAQAPSTSAAASPTIAEAPTTTSTIAQGLVTSELAPVVPSSALRSEIGSVADVAGTTEHIESAGMLIDCDFMRYCDQDTHLTSGTLPFMAIEALRGGAPGGHYRHHSGHDLESLLYTILTICHYTLAKEKAITLQAFTTYLKDGLSPYWADFAEYLQDLIKVTWDTSGVSLIEKPNIATHAAYRDILQRALNLYNQEETASLAHYAVVPKAKRALVNQFLPQAKRARLDSANSSVESLLSRPDVVRSFQDYRPSVETSSQEDITNVGSG